MLEDFDYSSFTKYLNEGLTSSDHDTANDLELLIDYYNDYPPSGFDETDSDFFREEIERLAQSQLPRLNSILNEKESSWLIVEAGKYRLGKAAVSQATGSTLEQNLSNDEIGLIKTHFQEISRQERRSLLNLYEQKVAKLGNEKEKLEVLKSLCNSYKYSIEDDDNYLIVLKGAGELSTGLGESDSHKYFERSAKLYREKYEHDESAKQFSLAIEASVKNGKSNEDILTLTRSMRIQYELAGDEEKAAFAFIEENKLKRLICGKSAVGVVHKISDYCQNPKKVAYCALVLIVISTLVYAFFGLVPSSADKQSWFCGDESFGRVLWDAIYFSIVTFTTLGYGDFSPSDGISRVMANIQSLGGLVLTSLFLVTLVRKYGR
ncbi:potassium channel family protein [Vibrio breoganii]